ncbi:hypothetical protein CYMTET_11749 [Cymbomonas tetramitiformis]|uniref:Uncharacterized protein n=1 Tax=Cymbomonas tetramitiformis TaxID=36881 RepID=A0AAE0GLY8_9CHLO|nr:hypothetical protein CYMTET_11749 [Cymbomonas tetramitiformis]
MLLLAMYTGRILLQTEHTSNHISSECVGKKNWECYFLPLSRCSDSSAARRAYAIADSEFHKQKGQQKGSDLEVLEDPVLLSSREGYRLPNGFHTYTVRVDEAFGKSGKGDLAFHAMKEAFRSQESRPNEWTIAGSLYFLRMQPWLKEEVDQRLRMSLPDDHDARRTISMPVRGSDKCFGHDVSHSAGGEVDCEGMRFKDFMEVAEKLRTIEDTDNRTVDTIILTSESAKTYEGWEQYTPRWRFVFNKGDVQQGTGSATGWENHAHSLGRTNVTILQVVISSMSTMHLQQRAKYFLGSVRSTWTMLIQAMAQAQELPLLLQSPPGDGKLPLQRRGPFSLARTTGVTSSLSTSACSVSTSTCSVSTSACSVSAVHVLACTAVGSIKACTAVGSIKAYTAVGSIKACTAKESCERAPPASVAYGLMGGCSNPTYRRGIRWVKPSQDALAFKLGSMERHSAELARHHGKVPKPLGCAFADEPRGFCVQSLKQHKCSGQCVCFGQTLEEQLKGDPGLAQP